MEINSNLVCRFQAFVGFVCLTFLFFKLSHFPTPQMFARRLILTFCADSERGKEKLCWMCVCSASSPYCPNALHTVHCTSSTYCILYIVHILLLYIVHILHTTYCILLSTHYILHTVHFKWIIPTLPAAYCTVNAAYYMINCALTVHTVLLCSSCIYTVHTVHPVFTVL